MSHRVIDTCIHHRWTQEPDLHRYLDKDWRAYVAALGTVNGQKHVARNLVPRFRYANPRGDDLKSARPGDGRPPGSSYELLAKQALDATGVDRALLVFDRGMFAPANANPHMATAVTKAINDWNVAEWLTRDERLHGLVLVPVQMPDEAAAEIRRVGQHSQMAGILIASGLGKLLGHPVYHPIYAAAAELDLPVVIHLGIDGIAETEQSSGPSGGPPLTFADYHTIAPIAVMNQLLSLMTNGLFTKYPNLRVCVMGAGFAWVPGWLRRLDLEWHSLRREVPWMQKPASDYMPGHVRICTYGLEGGSPDILAGLLAANPEMRELLCYGSGYPSWDTSSVSELEALLPEDWVGPVLSENADSWFRWSSAAVPAGGR